MPDDNGQPKQDVLTIMLCRDPWGVTIGGNVENLNLALDMLAEATRAMEVRWRMGVAAEFQQMRSKEAEDASRVRSILDRARIKV